MYEHLARWFYDTCWAILPTKLEAMRAALDIRVAGGTLTTDEVAQRIGAGAAVWEVRHVEPESAAPRPAPRANGGTIAVLPLFGVISQRANLLTQASGGTSTEMFASAFKQTISDDTIGAVVLDVDSPGGSVQGVDELASLIYESRGRKPIIASANALAASAAYWIASAADELVMTPSGEVGSIGVIALHEDRSRERDTRGITTTVVSAGKFKSEGNPFEPLAEEGRSFIQLRVDDYYTMFTRAVARQRNVPVDRVRSGYGEGRVLGARAALAEGMVDRLETFDDTITRVRRQVARSVSQSQVAVDFARRQQALAEMSQRYW